MDQLGQILNRVNVVVWGRGDETHPRCRATGLGDLWQHFMAGQFAAFARLRALDDLNLDFVGVDEVVAGHPETAGGDLFDR